MIGRVLPAVPRGADRALDRLLEVSPLAVVEHGREVARQPVLAAVLRDLADTLER